MVIMLVITWRTSSLRYLLRAGSYWNTWGAGLNWGRLGQTGTELHRLGGLPRVVSSVKQKGWFADEKRPSASCHSTPSDIEEVDLPVTDNIETVSRALSVAIREHKRDNNGSVDNRVGFA